MTPYAAHKLVNNRLAKENLPLIPPQMMYNYTTSRINKNKTPLIACDENGVVESALEEWINKYVAKKIAQSYV